MQSPVVWFEVIGSEGAKLRSFYGELFGWRYDVNAEMDYGMVAADAGRGIPGGVGSGDAQRVTFYVSTPSIDDALAQAKRLGGDVLMPRTALPDGMFLGMIRDPEGNAVGLVEEHA